MDKEQIRTALLEGAFVVGRSWFWNKNTMRCSRPGCCDEEFDTLEDTLSCIESYCGGFNECKILFPSGRNHGKD